MERKVMKKSKQNFILICMYKKIHEPILQDKNVIYKIYEPFVKTNKKVQSDFLPLSENIIH
jgi:hypothetical protein